MSLCSDTGPGLKISYYINTNIPKSGKKLKLETLLFPSILEKGYSTCILFSETYKLVGVRAQLQKSSY